MPQATRFRGAGVNVSFDLAGDSILPFRVYSLNQNDAGLRLPENQCPHSEISPNRGSTGAAAPGQQREVATWSQATGLSFNTRSIVWPGHGLLCGLF